MIRTDEVMIYIQNNLYVGVDDASGRLMSSRAYRPFKFGELQEGSIAGVHPEMCFADEASACGFEGVFLKNFGPDESTPGESWELA